jgi:hypothetical protein
VADFSFAIGCGKSATCYSPWHLSLQPPSLETRESDTFNQQETMNATSDSVVQILTGLRVIKVVGENWKLILVNISCPKEKEDL